MQPIFWSWGRAWFFFGPPIQELDVGLQQDLQEGEEQAEQHPDFKKFDAGCCWQRAGYIYEPETETST